MALLERPRISDGHCDEQPGLLPDEGVSEERRDIGMVIAHAWEALRATFRTRASEWMLGGACMSLGLLFIIRGDLFSLDRNFDYIRTIAPQYVWGWGAMVIGAFRITVLLINGAWWPTPIFRSLTAALCCFLWFHLWVGFLPNFALMFVLMPWMFMLDAYNALRVGEESGFALFHDRVKRRNDGPRH